MINPTTNTVIATITVGSAPAGVAVNAANGDVYVTNDGSGTVSVIDANPLDTRTYNTVIATITVGTNPNAVAANATNNDVYVTNFTDNTVSVIDANPTDPNYNTVIETIAIPLYNSTYANPTAVAVSSAGTYAGDVYVTNQGSGTVSVINPGNTIVATIPLATNADPYGVAVGSTGTIYAADLGNSTVSVIDPGTYAVTTISVGFEPVGVAVSPITGDVYVTNSASGTLSVIDGSPNDITYNTVIATIPVGNLPVGVAVSPIGTATGDIVYVANAGSGTVSVLTPATEGIPS